MEMIWDSVPERRTPDCPPSPGRASEDNPLMPFTVASLTGLLHHFYPRHFYTTDAVYDQQPEAVALREVRRKAQAENDGWNAFLQRLQHNLSECRLWELPYLLYDPCRCIRISLPDSLEGAPEQKAVVLLVSILAPVHHIYASRQRVESRRVVEQQLWHPPLPKEYQSIETRLSSLAQSLLGTSSLPNEVLLTPVPDIQVGNLDLGQAQLIHGLFTDRLW